MDGDSLAFGRYLRRHRTLMALYIAWEVLPSRRKRDVLIVARAFAREESSRAKSKYK